MLFSQLDLPAAWRPLFRGLSRLGWDLEEELPEVPSWASRPVLLFGNGYGEQLFLSFFQLPEWCGNTRPKGGITVVGVSQQFPESLEEAEGHSLVLEINWEDEVEGFLAGALQELAVS